MQSQVLNPLPKTRAPCLRLSRRSGARSLLVRGHCMLTHDALLWDSNPAALREANPGLHAAKEAFLQQYNQQYGYNGWLDANYESELGCRLGPGQHYLDWTGAGQYTNTQIRKCLSELTSSNFGNPHSRNPSSTRSTHEVDQARKLILQHFNADPAEYDVVFTKGATEALKMVSENFPWTPTSTFTYLQANHKSVLGMGTYAKRAGAKLKLVTEQDMQQWLDESQQSSHPVSSVADGFRSSSDSSSNGSHRLNGSSNGRHHLHGNDNSNGNGPSSGSSVTCHLVAYPLKDNYEGVLYPEEWVGQVHAKSDSSNKYMVVADAAAFVPTHTLDLSHVKADFIPLSFYKMFGYPSGLGALIVRKDASQLLSKLYFGGGAVDYCTAEDVWHVFSPLPAGWEDGTVGFLSIAGLKYGFAQLKEIGGMQAISGHVESLRCWTYQQLQHLKHSNGAPMIRLFGKHAEGPKHQSCIFQFQVLCPGGSPLPSGVVEKSAAAVGVQLRSGCNCNPGKCLTNLGITPEEERMRAASHHTGQMLTVLRPASQAQGSGHHLGTSHNLTPETTGAPAAQPAEAPAVLVPVQIPTGSVRVSLGYLSTFEDVYAFVQFVRHTFADERAVRLLAESAWEPKPEKPEDAEC